MRDEFLLWETVCLPASFCQSGRHYYYYYYFYLKKYRARHYVACDIDFKMALWCLTAAQCGADACSLGDSEREEGKKAGQLPHCCQWAVRTPFAAAAPRSSNNRDRDLLARGGR